MSEKKRPLPHPNEEIAATPVLGEPVDVWEQVNKYGTYEVQDTTDSDHAFPCIGPCGGWQACVDIAQKEVKTAEKKPER